MIRSTSFLAAFLLALFAISIAYAAKPATPKKQLEKDATHIVVGEVKAISLSTKIVDVPTVSHSARITGKSEKIRYIAEISISKIEKGEGLRVGDVVRARYRWSKWLGPGVPPPDDLGHRPRPAKDDSVRVYLVNKGYNGAGYTTDGGYDVYYNNGFEILAPASR